MDARTRLNLSFGNMSPAEIVELTRRVYSAMKGNDAIPKPDGNLAPTLESLHESGEALGTSVELTKAGNKTQAQLQIRDDRVAECKKKLVKIGHFAQLTLSEDPQLLASCGFDLVRLRSGGIIKSGILAPAGLTVDNLPHSGAVVASVTPVKGALCYQIQITDGDPTVEENWKHYDVFGSATKMHLDLEACKRFSVRARAIGRNEKSPWSTAVTTVVT